MCAEEESSTSCGSAAQRPNVVFVQPSKALEFSETGATRVTPLSSLRSILGGDSGEYELHGFPKAAIAVRRLPRSSPVRLHCHVCESSITVVTGKIDNSDYFKWKHELDPLCSDAEIVQHLHKATKYGFLGALRGQFAFVHYDEESEQALAATDCSGTHDMMQGEDSTGGLLITDSDISVQFKLSKIPAASFIFGRYRGRHTHKYASTALELEKSSYVAHQAALRALSGIPCHGDSEDDEASCSSGVSSPSTIPQQKTQPPHSRPTGFHRGRADSAHKWRRNTAREEEFIPGTSPDSVLFVECALDKKRVPRPSSGRADSAKSWKRGPSAMVCSH